MLYLGFLDVRNMTLVLSGMLLTRGCGGEQEMSKDRKFAVDKFSSKRDSELG